MEEITRPGSGIIKTVKSRDGAEERDHVDGGNFHVSTHVGEGRRWALVGRFN
jgi:hypothetical protein